MSTLQLPRAAVRLTPLALAFSLMAVRLSATAGTTYGNGGHPWAAHPNRVSIEAEYFDEGGEGIAYHDVDGRRAGTFRPTELVDVGPISSGTDTPGFMVSSIVAGEWLRYTVDIMTTGRYRVRFRVANAGAPIADAITMGWKGATVGSPVAVPSTGAIDSFTDVVVVDVPFTDGTDAFQVTFAAGGFLLNSVSIEPVGPLYYADWIQQYFPGGSPAQIAAGADPDGDGRSNLLEYCTVGRPDIAETPPRRIRFWTDPVTGAQYLAIGVSFANGRTEIAEISDDLATWSHAGADIVAEGAAAQSVDGFLTSQLYRSTHSVAERPRQFVRVRFTLP